VNSGKEKFALGKRVSGAYTHS